MKRVAVTGIGLVTPLGHSTREVFESACAGRSAIQPIIGAATGRLRSPLAATVQFDTAEHFDVQQQRLLDRVAQFAVVAARRALADSDGALTSLDPSRVGVFLGTGMAGIASLDDGYRTLYADA